jgi:hypothetical protein
MKTLEKAKKIAEKIKIKNGYQEQVIKCCQLCSFSRQTCIEDDLTCVYLHDDQWRVDEVSNLGVCNLFNPIQKFNPMTKTDELIKSKIKASILKGYERRTDDGLHYITIKDAERAMEKYVSQLKEQIKKEGISVNLIQIRDLTDEEWLKLPKEEILQLYKNCYSMLMNYIKLSGEKIEDIQTFTTTTNPSVMPDTCCGKYEEEQSLKSIRDKLNPQSTQIGKEPQYITNARESFKCKKEEVIGFDVIDRHNKKCFDETLENIKQSMKDKEQSLKSAEEILLEVYGCKTVKEFNKCFDISGEMITEVCKRYHDQFHAATVKDITNLPYPDPISKHQTDINIGWMRAMKYMKDQPVKDITDEEIEKYFNKNSSFIYEGTNKISFFTFPQILKFVKWMRSKMK